MVTVIVIQCDGGCRALQEDFEAAAERISNTPGPNNDEMLELYGLFKQAKVGDNNTGEHLGSAPLQQRRQQLPRSCCTAVHHCVCIPALQLSRGCWISRARRSGKLGTTKKVRHSPRLSQAEPAAVEHQLCISSCRQLQSACCCMPAS